MRGLGIPLGLLVDIVSTFCSATPSLVGPPSSPAAPVTGFSTGRTAVRPGLLCCGASTRTWWPGRWLRRPRARWPDAASYGYRATMYTAVIPTAPTSTGLLSQQSGPPLRRWSVAFVRDRTRSWSWDRWRDSAGRSSAPSGRRQRPIIWRGP